MVKVAIIGCGKIADAHLAEIQKIPGGEVVGACDRELLMARQLCERFHIHQAFDQVETLLSECRPDVVHITTPPQSQYEIGRQCLESGSHVYIEKPFGMNSREAEKILSLAKERGRKCVVGHDLQFSPVARRMRQLVREGYLGGTPIHLESYYCYDLSDPVYAKSLLADKQHWVRRLAGKLLHNVISHGIARIAEFIENDHPLVFAHGFISPLLRSLGEDEIIDELRVIISDGGRTTAFFTFSSQMRPSLNHFRLYGPKNGLESDEDHQTLIRYNGKRFKS
ncbi:MAG: Gfo/Idh/MocA family oxidoreductase, partial [Thermodesulfobacteriota bacterium]